MSTTSGLTLLHVDAAWLVVDKPAGLLSVPGRGADKADCVQTRLQADYPDALTVHRLDMATSGLLVYGRGATAQRRLSLAFEARQVDKQYLAVVAGLLAEDSGEISLPLAADWPRRPLQRVCLNSGKSALTRWQVLERDPLRRTTRLLLSPATGRTHQLRVHLLAIGHPILGDALYAPAAQTPSAERLMLHAWRLQLPHPLSGQLCRFEAPPPF